MRFRKGDLLAKNFTPIKEPVARVERVTKKGVIHCVNLIDCETMKKGAEFSFSPDVWTGFILYSRD